MKLNILLSCTILWIAVEVISVVISIIRSRKEDRNYRLASLYVKRMLFLLNKSTPKENLLQKLYYSLVATKGNRRLCKIILKAIVKGDLTHSFLYIQKVLSYEPVELVNKIVLEKRTESKIVVDEVLDSLKLCSEVRKQIKNTLFKNKMKILSEKMFFISANMALLYRLQNEYSLLIFIIVNTIGVILFIVLEAESTRVNGKVHEGKLARRKNIIKKTHAPAVGLKTLYQLMAGMGLILNISMVVYQFLEQAV